eukprot:TRINITY_DN6846_c0_g1_i7.p1 TRINITY_DN6846_c0_g1~~TRINITY_DN6846_c0_g1_i7.p1  ORF type:complete len:442 (-),score=34.17 TRINITY_DN6846_c0_g1_i7:62-1387(-)
MREIITIEVGQAGVQVGSACWELFCLQHGIQPDGKLSSQSSQKEQVDSFYSFFSETKEKNYVPRSLMFDLEPTILDQVQTGPLSQLFNPETFVSGKEDASSNYARGRYRLGKDIVEICLDRLRKLADQCSQLQGFIVFSSVAGGTGSGLGSLLLERISEDYQKSVKLNFPIYPSPETSSAIIEPYNYLLSTHKLLEHSNVSIVLDNEAVYEICKKKLEIQKPLYLNMNRLIAQVVSSLTMGLRFNGCLNGSLDELEPNLVPYPRFKFMISSQSPIFPASKKTDLEELSNLVSSTLEAYKPANIMVKCDSTKGSYITTTLNYIGDLIPKHTGPTVLALKYSGLIKFVDWYPTGFKCGITYEPPLVIPGGDIGQVPRAVSMISNSTSIDEVFIRNNAKFDIMYKKRAFLHWFVNEGLEEGEFLEARNNLAELHAEYELSLIHI